LLAENLLYRKWKTLRDSYFRAKKAGKNYKFSERMQFLTQAESDEEEEEDEPPPAKRRKMECEPPLDPFMSFLLSLHSELKKVWPSCCKSVSYIRISAGYQRCDKRISREN